MLINLKINDDNDARCAFVRCAMVSPKLVVAGCADR